MFIKNSKRIVRIIRDNKTFKSIIHAGHELWQAIRYLKGYTIGGNAEVKDGRIVGVGDEFAWNQLVEDTSRSVSQRVVNNQIVLTPHTSTNRVAGHKYLLCFDWQAEPSYDGRVRCRAFNNGAFTDITPSEHNAVFINSASTDNDATIMKVVSLDSYTGTASISNNQLFDLTAMGIADRITTIEDFKTYLKSHSMMDKDATEIPYFGYDSGSVKTSLPIVASNQSGSESTTYPLLVSKPLYKVGSVADVAKFGEGVTRKYKKVNLGDLSWSKGTIYQGTHSFFRADITNARHPSTSAELPTWLLTSAPYTIGKAIDNNNNTMDMILTQWEVTGQIRIHNFAFDNATPAEFAEAMKAYDLLYELAEPVTEAVDLPKIVDYQPTILTTDTEVQGDITIEE